MNTELASKHGSLLRVDTFCSSEMYLIFVHICNTTFVRHGHLTLSRGIIRSHLLQGLYKSFHTQLAPHLLMSLANRQSLPMSHPRYRP